MRAAPTAGIVVSLLAALVAPEVAAQQENCRQFSWSMGREINLFDEPLPVVESAQSLPKEGVFALALKPTEDVIYRVPPERGSDSRFGATITLETIPAGRYQIALSEKAWVDAVQEDKRLPILGTHGTGCRGVRFSVDVEVKGEPLTLQVGGATVPKLSIAVVRIWPFEWRW
jgi:hypothetical protein